MPHSASSFSFSMGFPMLASRPGFPVVSHLLWINTTRMTPKKRREAASQASGDNLLCSLTLTLGTLTLGVVCRRYSFLHPSLALVLIPLVPYFSVPDSFCFGLPLSAAVSVLAPLSAVVSLPVTPRPHHEVWGNM